MLDSNKVTEAAVNFGVGVVLAAVFCMGMTFAAGLVVSYCLP